MGPAMLRYIRSTPKPPYSRYPVSYSSYVCKRFAQISHTIPPVPPRGVVESVDALLQKFPRLVQRLPLGFLAFGPVIPPKLMGSATILCSAKPKAEIGTGQKPRSRTSGRG